MTFTKTTTRAFAASLAMVAAGGTIAGAAVFHLPILGLGRADVASADTTPAVAKRAVPAAPKKVHPKVVVKTRYADVIVHVPAPSSGGSVAAAALTAPAAPALQPASSEPADSVPEVTEPEETTPTSVSTTPTVGEHDDEGEHEGEGEHEDAPDMPEHGDDATTTTTVGQS